MYESRLYSVPLHAVQLYMVDTHPALKAPNIAGYLSTWFFDSTTFPMRSTSAKDPAAPRKRYTKTLRAREKNEPSDILINLLSEAATRSKKLKLKDGISASTGTGIDLAVRGHEVRKLFYAAFARGLIKDGYNPEDALQEVYRGLLARNKGTCPFDVTKSSFGHYVHIVTGCVLANYVRKEKRKLQFETLESQMSPGMYSTGDSTFCIQDAPDLHKGTKIEQGSLEDLASSISVSLKVDRSPVQEALQMLAEGHPIRKVCATLKVTRPWLDDVLADARVQLLG